MQATNGVPVEIKDRIVAAANSLYEQSGRQVMPTVDQVRRMAKVDMNAASQVMREWKRAQNSQNTPVVINIPEAVQTAANSAVITIWQQAQELANENLKNAHSAWDQERQDFEAMRAELADAFELQAAELDQIKIKLTQANELNAQQAKQMVELQEKIHSAKTQSETAAARLIEIDRNVSQLRVERDAAVKSEQQARENAAKLEGALSAVQAHNKALLDTIGSPKKK